MIRATRASSNCCSNNLDAASSNGRSSTSTTQRAFPDGPAMPLATAANPTTGSDMSAPEGIRWANAPNGTAAAEPFALTRTPCSPVAFALEKHSSANRVLPTPATPAITTDRSRSRFQARSNCCSSTSRPMSGHCASDGETFTVMTPCPLGIRSAQSMPPVAPNGLYSYPSGSSSDSRREVIVDVRTRRRPSSGIPDVTRNVLNTVVDGQTAAPGDDHVLIRPGRCSG